MSDVAYTVSVSSQKRLSDGSFGPRSTILDRSPITLDYQSGKEATVSFNGFTFHVRALGPQNQIEYRLTKPGHPFSDNFAVAFGGTHTDGNSLFRIVDFQASVSPDEKFVISVRLPNA